MSKERDCSTCAKSVQGSVPVDCHFCLLNIDTLPSWEGITISKAYDAAFREETPKVSDRRIQLEPKKESSDGSTAGYYTLPKGATELQDLISHKDMNAQMGEIFRAVYRFGEVAHSPKIRDIKKIIFYAQEELKRLEKLEVKSL